MSVLNNDVLWLTKSWLAHDSKTVEDSFKTVCSDRGRFLDKDYTPYDIGSWINLPVEDGKEFIQLSRTRIRVPEIMLLANYNHIPVRTVVFCRRNIWRRDRGRCFVPETLILMENGGFQPINSIEVGDRVLDAEGNVQDVDFVFSKHTNDDLVVLRHRGNGDYLTCTSDHRILVSDKNFNTKWVEAGDITTNDYLFELSQVPHLQNIQNGRIPRPLDLNIICNALKNLKYTDHTVRDYNRKTVHRHVSIDEKLGRFVGYFLAEGNVFDNRVTFSLHIDEDDFASDIQKLIKSIFDVDVSLKKFPDKHLQQVICNSSIIAEFVRNWCFHNAEKRVQSKDLPRNYLKGILYGILRGDGTFNEDQFRATLMMKTENLIRDIYLVSHLCGIRATLSKTGRRKDGRSYKSVIYNAQEFNKIAQVCMLEKKQYTRNSKVYI